VGCAVGRRKGRSGGGEGGSRRRRCWTRRCEDSCERLTRLGCALAVFTRRCRSKRRRGETLRLLLFSSACLRLDYGSPQQFTQRTSHHSGTTSTLLARYGRRRLLSRRRVHRILERPLLLLDQTAPLRALQDSYPDSHPIRSASFIVSPLPHA
jgi:hypothetical protein